MGQKHKIELSITLADGGNNAKDVIEFYGVEIRDDIDQTAWNLCDCNDQVQASKFGNLVLDGWDVTHKRGDDFRVKAEFTVIAQGADFVSQVLDEYMDGFADSITATQKEYYSRTGKRVALNANPLSWEVKIK